MGKLIVCSNRNPLSVSGPAGVARLMKLCCGDEIAGLETEYIISALSVEEFGKLCLDAGGPDALYLAHDCQAVVGLKIHGAKNVAMVYHQQGSQQYEARIFGHPEAYQEAYKEQMETAFDYCRIIGFPTRGAIWALEQTGGKVDASKVYTPLLNTPHPGLTDGKQMGSAEYQVIEAIRDLKKQGREIWASVGSLVEAKGIDLVPQVIRGSSVHPVWVLVGKGPMLPNIQAHCQGLDDCWHVENACHDFVLKLLQLTDRYIMRHRYTVHDFATLEARAAGCMVDLSDIPGQLEAGKVPILSHKQFAAQYEMLIKRFIMEVEV